MIDALVRYPILKPATGNQSSLTPLIPGDYSDHIGHFAHPTTPSGFACHPSGGGEWFCAVGLCGLCDVRRATYRQ